MRNHSRRTTAFVSVLFMLTGGVEAACSSGPPSTAETEGVSAQAATAASFDVDAAVAFANSQWNCWLPDCSTLVDAGDGQPDYVCADFVSRSIAAGGAMGPSVDPTTFVTDPFDYGPPGNQYDLDWVSSNGPICEATSGNASNIGLQNYLDATLQWQNVGTNPSDVVAGDVVFVDGDDQCSEYVPYAHVVFGVGNGLVDAHNNARYQFAVANYTIDAIYRFKASPPPVDAGTTPGPTGYGIVTTPSGDGYWQWMSNGAVFSWGDAHYHGGANTITSAAKPIVGMARDATGGGYWQVAQSGKVYAFGDAANDGGLDTIPHSSPAVGIASDGTGYWIVTQDGAIYSFGATYHNGASGISHAPIVAIQATTSGGGYWLLASDGAIYSYGDAG
jgi:hypothetical protein